ncbi:MAG: amidohydrolase, partial [Alphaproteobacteria bacterium]|nr:amidohydrolase [Alphaproteobacteria bacterium]
IVWGTDAVWTGAPQWQIEGLRRLEIPEEMQEKYGFSPLGPADGPLKTAIFGGNSTRLYALEQHAEAVKGDRFAQLKADYLASGGGRSNVRYGYVTRTG